MVASLMLEFIRLLYIFREGKVDLEAKFSPNLLNTTVYIISMSLQVSTFAVNYRVSVELN